MERYLLDTNICIFFLKGKYNLNVKLKEVGLQNCCISEITLAELKYGAECSNRILENKEMIDGLTKELTILPIFNSLNIYAKEKARLRKSGKILDDFDLLIGATAIANNLILVTENEKHLSRMSKINFESWINR
ncbi:MAG TPA: type II toxin-antitoxin system VapC family toxin [Prolixibacteraceae bacterium]|nr:type II toxin-antitoxin system VapC family toxin [Prolixibacteraceae bacterium]